MTNSSNNQSSEDQSKKGSPIVEPSHSNDNHFGVVPDAQADRENWLIHKLKSTGSILGFVGTTMKWGTIQTLDFKNNNIVENHDQQHGLDDGRSELFHALSGVVETIATGNPEPSMRVPALASDYLHSNNLVRHSGGRDMMTGEPNTINVPDYVQNVIDSLREEKEVEGQFDVQNLQYQFSKNATNWQKVAETFTDEYNRWLSVNRFFNLKAFPTSAGRTIEMTTGVGFMVVGTLIANQQDVGMEIFNNTRGGLEFFIGLTTVVSTSIDMFVSEEDEDSDIEVGDHSEFINTSRAEKERAITSILKYIPRTLATMHNDSQIFEMLAEVQESPEKTKEFEEDIVLQQLLKSAVKRQEKSSSLTQSFRSVVGDVIGDIKEQVDHLKDVRDNMRQSDKPVAVLSQDLKSKPTRYGGMVQLIGSQAYLPLAGVTAIWGAAVASSPVMAGAYIVSGAVMGASWFYSHRGNVAKTKMTLRGININEDGSKPAP